MIRRTDARAVGVWAQWPDGARWSNEGMTRLLGFLVEGIARSGGKYVFRIVLPDSVRDAAEEDLKSLDASLGRDFTLHSPRDARMPCHSFADLAAFANKHVPVSAWLTLFPGFSYARLLDAPLTVIFPDAIPKVFHEFGRVWDPEGTHTAWEKEIRTLLPHASGVITFSKHVAREHAERLFGVPGDKITVLSHAAPDLEALLPFMKERRRSKESVAQAAELLRRHCASRGWDYLRDFPFEEASFIALSTQDRVTKNIQLAARAAEILVRERRQNIKLLMTAPLHYDEDWTVLPSMIKATQSQFDVVSMPDLPRTEHAALLHCAAVIVHPSIFEGGHAPFPFFEGASVGTPSLMAMGPHLGELAESEPAILDYVVDPNDPDGLAAAIADVLERRDEVVEEQQRIYTRLHESSWATVAASYAETALKAASAA